MKLRYLFPTVFLFVLVACSSDSPSEEPDVIDDEVSVILDCDAVINLSIGVISNTDFEISWTTTGDYSSFEIEYGIKGFKIGEGERLETSERQITINELLPDTAYEVYVRGICDSDFGDWLNKVSAITGCDLGFFEGNIFLSTQDEVNEFGNTCYTAINGNLTIQSGESSNGISDLSPLSRLTEITGALLISHNLSIESLNGLENLEKLGVAYIHRNRNLNSISSLNKITTLNGSISINGSPAISGLTITDNLSLQSLAGLESLESVVNIRLSSTPINSLEPLSKLRTVANTISISFTDLTSMEGLHSLSQVENFSILFNQSLSSLDGLQGLRNVNNLLYIWQNNSLQTLTGLEGLLYAKRIEIHNNESLLSIEALVGYETFEVVSLRNLPALYNLEGINISKITSFLEIIECNTLQNFQGINVESENTSFIQVTNCENITSFSGLERLTEVEGLLINNNRNLASMMGFENLILSRNFIDLIDNPNLRDVCALTNLFQNGQVLGPFTNIGNGVPYTFEEIVSGLCK